MISIDASVIVKWFRKSKEKENLALKSQFANCRANCLQLCIIKFS